MSNSPALAPPLPTAVPNPYRTPPDPAGLRPSAATVALVRSQVQAMLSATPVYHSLDQPDKRRLEEDMVKISAYAAECVRDDWLQSERIGQRPLVRYRESRAGPLAQAQEGFQPAAASQVARLTQDTIKAIAFPTFVADLIKGTFEAITNSSIQQMQAYLRLLENVGMTVDQFMNSNISDDQARDYLTERYPDHIQISNHKAAPRDGAEDRPAPDFQADLNLSDAPSLDEDGVEGTLVPAARRRLAQMRLQLLSTLVLMGINRIVVTGGKIRATMLFHIDASDRLRQEHASDLDTRVAASGSFGFGPWQASASMSFSYVSSDRSTSESDLNVSADLTGEVEIHFKSDYFPLERFAPSGTVSRIQANTAVPEANTPNLRGDVPWGPAVQAPPAPTRQPLTSTLTPGGGPLPPAKMPAAPTPPPAPRPAPAPAPPASPPPASAPAGAPAPGRTPPATPAPGGAPPATPAPGGAPPATPAPGGAPPATPAPGGAPPATPAPGGAPPATPAPGGAPPAPPVASPPPGGTPVTAAPPAPRPAPAEGG